MYKVKLASRHIPSSVANYKLCYWVRRCINYLVLAEFRGFDTLSSLCPTKLYKSNG